MERPKNILLVAPNSERDMADQALMCPHLGIIRIAGFLKKNGHYTEYLDPNILHFVPGVSLEEKLTERKWDIIGFSTLDETLINDIQNMYLAKKICPDALIVAGGIEAQHNYQNILDKSPCRIVILGEGEIPLLKIANDEPWQNIPGVIMKNNAEALTHEIFWSATEAIEWEKVPYEKYWDYYVSKYGENLTDEASSQIHTVRLFTKNRCPFGCLYCSSTSQLTFATAKGVRIVGLTSEQIIACVKRIRDSHPRAKTVYFTDDDFAVIPRQLVQFCGQMAVENPGISLMCLCRMTDLNDDSIASMVRAGFRNLNIGVETFSERQLVEINKQVPAVKIHENLKLLRKHGLNAFMNIILITPECTLDDIETTCDWVMHYIEDGFFNAGVNLSCVPLKGSAYYERYWEYVTKVEKIPNTKYFLKRDQIIWAMNPHVRELQKIAEDTIESYIEEKRKELNIFHGTASNLSYLKVQYVKKLIHELRTKHGLPETRPYSEEEETLFGAQNVQHEQHFCSFKQETTTTWNQH